MPGNDALIYAPGSKDYPGDHYVDYAGRSHLPTAKEMFDGGPMPMPAINRPNVGAVSLVDSGRYVVMGTTDAVTNMSELDWRGGSITNGPTSKTVYVNVPEGMTDRKIYAFVMLLDDASIGGSFTDGELVFYSNGTIVGRLPCPQTMEALDHVIGGSPMPTWNITQSKATISKLVGTAWLHSTVYPVGVGVTGTLPPDLIGATVRAFQGTSFDVPSVAWFVSPIYVTGTFDTIEMKIWRSDGSPMSGWAMLGCCSSNRN